MKNLTKNYITMIYLVVNFSFLPRRSFRGSFRNPSADPSADPSAESFRGVLRESFQIFPEPFRILPGSFRDPSGIVRDPSADPSAESFRNPSAEILPQRSFRKKIDYEVNQKWILPRILPQKSFRGSAVPLGLAFRGSFRKILPQR